MTETTRRLDLLLATHGPDGLECVERMDVPRIPGVHYIVVWQIPADFEHETPQALRRDDMEIIRDDSVGVSRNHNIALSHAKAEYCLVADNDLHYYPEGLRAVIDTLDSHPDVDLATFRFDGVENKWYPETECSLNERLPKGMHITMFEVAFRRKSVVGKVRFNENFGVGAPVLKCGIDSIFIVESRRAGLNMRFFPITIVRHDHPTTGHRRITTPGVAMGEGAYIRMAYGWKGFPRVPLFVWRNRRRGRLRFFWGLYHVTRGFFYRLRPF